MIRFPSRVLKDDDLSSSTGYHNALPLEVHGAGYNQMALVSNAKAFRLVRLLEFTCLHCVIIIIVECLS